jgi:hypothetical protein
MIDYRDKNGPFKSIDGRKKVPGVATAKVDGKKTVGASEQSGTEIGRGPCHLTAKDGCPRGESARASWLSS